jgi:cytoskeletal protein RodZ
MNKDIDFSAYGKGTPYKVPERFFENLPHQTLLLAKKREAKRKGTMVLTISLLSAAAGIALVVVIALLMQTSGNQVPQFASSDKTTVLQPDSAARAHKIISGIEITGTDSVKTMRVATAPKAADTVADKKTVVNTSLPADVPNESIDDLLAHMSDDMLLQLADNSDDDLFIND